MGGKVDFSRAFASSSGSPHRAPPASSAYIFPGPGNRELNDHSHEGRQNEDQKGSNRILAIPIPAAAKPEGKPSQRRNSACHDGGNSANEDIPMKDMAHFMPQDAGNFRSCERVHKARRHADRGMLGIAARGKGIGQHGCS